jgi:hypothetical protein
MHGSVVQSDLKELKTAGSKLMRLATRAATIAAVGAGICTSLAHNML